MRLVAVTVMTAGGHAETFRTTSEHPFYVPIDGWVQVDQLRPGDATTTLGGSEAVVVGISYTGEQAEVFNLEVEGLHDYYVGASGVLVHNGGICEFLNVTSGYIENSKISQYLMNVAHPQGGGKAKFFREVLGFSDASVDSLREQLLRGAQGPIRRTGKAAGTGNYKGEAVVLITGPNGKTASVLTVWEEQNGVARLITAYPN